MVYKDDYYDDENDKVDKNYENDEVEEEEDDNISLIPNLAVF